MAYFSSLFTREVGGGDTLLKLPVGAELDTPEILTEGAFLTFPEVFPATKRHLHLRPAAAGSAAA